jgi:hypothetical protein
MYILNGNRIIPWNDEIIKRWKDETKRDFGCVPVSLYSTDEVL